MAANSGVMLESLSEEDLLTALDEKTRQRVQSIAEKQEELMSKLQKLERELTAMQNARGNLSHGLARLAHAILNSKELIYVY